MMSSKILPDKRLIRALLTSMSTSNLYVPLVVPLILIANCLPSFVPAIVVEPFAEEPKMLANFEVPASLEDFDE